MSEPGKITVPLSRPLDIGGGEMLRAVVLREPRMREYARLGEPIIYVPDVNGMDVPVEVDDVIEKYLAALVVEPDIPNLIGRLHLVDGIRVKEALLGFFLDCRQEALRPPAPCSSSTSVGSAPSSGTI